MLRAILRWSRLGEDTGGQLHTSLFTIDFDAPEIEAQLQRGGRGPMGFERVCLEGVEVLPPTTTEGDRKP
jgi:hypothetical protein